MESIGIKGILKNSKIMTIESHIAAIDNDDEKKYYDTQNQLVETENVDEDMDDQMEDEGENDAITKAPIRTATDPGCPTTEELNEHYLTHLPHRSWCPVCIKARGKEDPHMKVDKSKRIYEKPTVCFDYKSFGQEQDTDDKITTLIVRDSTKMTFKFM